MFYTPQDGHGLAHNPFSAIIAPRPIAWISTQDAQGNSNLAPYSFFNATAYVPPQVMFASTSAKADRTDTKDTVDNIRQTGVFCINIVKRAAIDAMNASSAPMAADQSEFTAAQMTPIPCSQIDCPRVAEAPASLECALTQVIRLEGEANFLVLGRVVGVHLDDAYIVDGRFRPDLFQVVARLGYQDYAAIDTLFELQRPVTPST